MLSSSEHYAKKVSYVIFCGILGTNFSHCQVTKALDALLVGLSDVAKKASEELGEGATEAQIVDRTIKLFLGKYESDRINFLIFHDRVAVFSNRIFFKLFRGIEPKCCSIVYDRRIRHFAGQDPSNRTLNCQRFLEHTR